MHKLTEHVGDGRNIARDCCSFQLVCASQEADDAGPKHAPALHATSFRGALHAATPGSCGSPLCCQTAVPSCAATSPCERKQSRSTSRLPAVAAPPAGVASSVWSTRGRTGTRCARRPPPCEPGRPSLALPHTGKRARRWHAHACECKRGAMSDDASLPSHMHGWLAGCQKL